jgi:hypothetical protein
MPDRVVDFKGFLVSSTEIQKRFGAIPPAFNTCRCGNVSIGILCLSQSVPIIPEHELTTPYDDPLAEFISQTLHRHDRYDIELPVCETCEMLWLGSGQAN